MNIFFFRQDSIKFGSGDKSKQEVFCIRNAIELLRVLRTMNGYEAVIEEVLKTYCEAEIEGKLQEADIEILVSAIVESNIFADDISD